MRVGFIQSSKKRVDLQMGFITLAKNDGGVTTQGEIKEHS